MDAEQIQSIDVINGTINSVPGLVDPGDKGLNVVFKTHSHFDDVKTREQGRPIFEMREYVMITVPGDTTSNVFRPAFEFDHIRFPEQYLRFKAGREQAVGTPLTEWSQITRAQVDELAFFKIQTIEQLASVSDGNCQRYLGLSQMRDKAKLYLEQTKSEAPTLALQAAIAEKDNEIATLQNRMAQMEEILKRLDTSGEDTPQPTPRRRASKTEERAEHDA